MTDFNPIPVRHTIVAFLLCFGMSSAAAQENGFIESNRQFNRGPSIELRTSGNFQINAQNDGITPTSGVVPANNFTPANRLAPANQVAPASLTTPARLLAAPKIPSGEDQIHISLHYLMVDDETRDSIYLQLGDENIKTRMQQIPDEPAPQPLAAQGSVLHASRSILTTSCASTCVLKREDKTSLLQQVAQSKGSKISQAPSIILIDGHEGEMNEIVQRPFVVAVAREEELLAAASKSKVRPASAFGDAFNGGSAQTSGGRAGIQVLDDGTSLRVRAAGRDQNHLHLSCDITYTRILDFHQQKVYGVGRKSAMVQVPKHQVETATVAEELEFGSTLMIDPYISREVEIREEQNVSLLSKTPYINRLFKNVAVAKVNQNWMILVQADREKR